MENLQATYRNRVRMPQFVAAERSATTGPEAAVKRYTTSPVIVILSTGLVAEVILPWVAIWLSDTLFFDIPAWSLWLLFGVPPAVSLMAVLVHWAWRICAKHLSRLPAEGWRGGIGAGSGVERRPFQPDTWRNHERLSSPPSRTMPACSLARMP